MRIGILTFHRAINYGGVLQCYCLYKTLEQMGHNPEIIDYRPEYIEQHRKAFSKFALKKRKGLISKITYLIGGVIKISSRHQVSNKFDSFFENLAFRNVKNNQIHDIKNIDAIIIGSDQVWSPCITDGIDTLFWGDFANEKLIIAAYAASLGKIDKKVICNEMTIKEKLSNFNFISLREEYAKQYIANLTEKDVECVCDPTLLASRAVLDSIAVKPKQSNYVLYYTLNEDPGMIDFAKKIANQIGASVLKVKPYKKIWEQLKVDEVYGVSPQEFCGYIKYAKCIVCKSFHGTILSTIFHKDFYSFKSIQIDRAESYLNTIGLSDRAVDCNDSVVFSHVNYAEAEIQIAALRQMSMKYLERVLGYETTK